MSWKCSRSPPIERWKPTEFVPPHGMKTIRTNRKDAPPPQRARGLDDRFVSLSEVLWIRLCRNSAAEAECKIRNCLAI